MAGDDPVKKRVVKKRRVTREKAVDADVPAPVSKAKAAKKKAGAARTRSLSKKSAGSSQGVTASGGESAEEDVAHDVPEMGEQPEDGESVGDEDESYSSDDEEGQLTRVGDVPLAWYKDEDHAGYDIEGNKIIKKTKDALATLLSKFDDPSEMITIYDKLTGEGHKLSPETLQTLLNLQKNKYPQPGYDAHPEGLNFIQWDQNPFDKGMRTKASFMPPRYEMKIVAKLMRKLERLEKYPPPPKEDPNASFLLWNDDDEPDTSNAARKRAKFHVGPPKAALPSTNESYNPPLEYLPTEEEKKAILAEEKIDQPDFISQKYDSLRQVPFYRNALRERYQRCLDLFSFTRKKKEKVNIVPDSLLPDLPKPEELRPFPQRLGFVYKGHTAPVRRVSVNHNGQFIATACDDHFVRVFEVNTGRLVTKWNLKAPVSCVGWSPNAAHNILSASADKLLCFAVPKSCANDATNEASVEYLRQALNKRGENTAATDAIKIVSLMNSGESDDEEGEQNARLLGELDEDVAEEDAPDRELVEWLDTEEAEAKYGMVLKAVHHFRIKNFAWHHKGDYVATLCPKDMKKRQIVLCQLSVYVILHIILFFSPHTHTHNTNTNTNTNANTQQEEQHCPVQAFQGDGAVPVVPPDAAVPPGGNQEERAHVQPGAEPACEEDAEHRGQRLQRGRAPRG